MPHAQKKKNADLNHAYAFVTSQGFVDAANALTEALVDSGFDRYEAKASIKPQKDPMLPMAMPLWETTSVTEVIQGKLTTEAIPKTVRDHVQTAPTKEETLITYSGPPISPPDEAKWSKALSSEDEKNAVASLARKSRGEDAWPAAMNKEEADCAVLLDSLLEVDFWVRNLERDRFAFWLQTPTDKFYPDFVAKLKDGRFLVIEYKGAHLMNEDTSEKEALGQLWEARSKGLCVFRLITKANMKTEILSAVRIA